MPMRKMKRAQVLEALAAAGARDDRQAFTRLYTENRVSLSVAMEHWRKGQKLRKFVEERDSITITDEGLN